jgi:SAM-dependent methyltransferase
MNDYPDYQTYTKLYGRYLTKSIEPFFDGIDLKGKRVLDLCAGAGQLSKYALEHGASTVFMVDTAPQMLNPDFKSTENILQVPWDVVDYIRSFHNTLRSFHNTPVNEIRRFDIVTCRQAVNYWFTSVTGEEIASLVKTGGRLIFNTFGNKPSEKPTSREYFHGGVAYTEVSYLIDDTVFHVQTAAGMAPHFTQFKWIDREEFQKKLTPYFILNEMIDGPSSMWYCTKI